MDFRRPELHVLLGLVVRGVDCLDPTRCECQGFSRQASETTIRRFYPTDLDTSSSMADHEVSFPVDLGHISASFHLYLSRSTDRTNLRRRPDLTEWPFALS